MSLAVIHALSTWMMVGLIVFVQVVHYPLFERVGRAEFPEYEKLHAMRTTWVVLPTMLVELLTAVWIYQLQPGFLTALGAALVVFIWLSTLLVQSPIHGRLSAGFDRELWGRLVSTNRWRTAAWVTRGAIVALLL